MMMSESVDDGGDFSDGVGGDGDDGWWWLMLVDDDDAEVKVAHMN